MAQCIVHYSKRKQSHVILLTVLLLILFLMEFAGGAVLPDLTTDVDVKSQIVVFPFLLLSVLSGFTYTELISDA